MKTTGLVTLMLLFFQLSLAHAEQIDPKRKEPVRRDISTSRPYPVGGPDVVIHNHTSLIEFLRAQQGRNITILLTSGQSVTGTVRLVGNHLVHLTHLSGKSYFDAVIPVEQVSSVEFRARQ